MAKTSFEEYTRRANAVHDGKYSYVESSFTVMNAKVRIVCPAHGEFELWATHHLKGSKCPHPSCRFDAVSFLQRARDVHGDRFSYPEPIEPQNGQIIIRCAVHGDFKQRPSGHLAGGGCKKCAQDKAAPKYDDLMLKLIEHDNRLTISRDDFGNRAEGKVRALCEIHGELYKTISSLLASSGCQACYFEGRLYPLDRAVQEAQDAWSDTYTYDWSGFAKDCRFVTPICSIHGSFKVRRGNHFAGFAGCRKCRRSSYGEVAVASWLDQRGVAYKQEWNSPDLLSPRGFRLRFDFYIPESNFFIEYDGPQHFRPWVFGTQTEEKIAKAIQDLEVTKKHDSIKDEWAKAKGIPLIRLQRNTLFLKLETEVAALLARSSTS
jgi:hypothetical protein